MSIATLVGVIAAFGLFFGSIMFTADNPLMFVDAASFVMVFGGTLSSTFIAYEPRYVLLSLKLILKIMAAPKIGREVLKAEVGRIIK
jgi:chemotaxis protein MotA